MDAFDLDGLTGSSKHQRPTGVCKHSSELEQTAREAEKWRKEGPGTGERSEKGPVREKRGRGQGRGGRRSREGAHSCHKASSLSCRQQIDSWSGQGEGWVHPLPLSSSGAKEREEWDPGALKSEGFPPWLPLGGRAAGALAVSMEAMPFTSKASLLSAPLHSVPVFSKMPVI